MFGTICNQQFITNWLFLKKHNELFLLTAVVLICAFLLFRVGNYSSGGCLEFQNRSFQRSCIAFLAWLMIQKYEWINFRTKDIITIDQIAPVRVNFLWKILNVLLKGRSTNFSGYTMATTFLMSINLKTEKQLTCGKSRIVWNYTCGGYMKHFAAHLNCNVVIGSVHLYWSSFDPQQVGWGLKSKGEVRNQRIMSPIRQSDFPFRRTDFTTSSKHLIIIFWGYLLLLSWFDWVKEWIYSSNPLITFYKQDSSVLQNPSLLA